MLCDSFYKYAGLGAEPESPQARRRLETAQGHVNESGHRTRSVIRMQRAQHNVPGKEACTAICAVSKSRISPIIILSGS